MPAVLLLSSLAVALGLVWPFLFGPWRAVPDDAVAPAPNPPIAAKNLKAWRAERAAIGRALAEYVYGPAPDPIAPVVVSRTPCALPTEPDAGTVEQWRIELGAAGWFHLVLALPGEAAPAPVILVLNYCGARAAFHGRPAAIAGPHLWAPPECRDARLDPLLRLAFGSCIGGPPLAMITRRGYAVALAYGGDIVPDHPLLARQALAKFAPGETGALSAWAWLYSRMADALAGDARLDASRMIVWGQSRQGKAALIAGARDPRFAAVVALQAGKAGDAPTQHRQGETVGWIMRAYPQWMSPRWAAYARANPPVDQHQLLAMVAPRPLLLGAARRDAWADPAGARAALAAAAPAWDLFDAARPQAYTRPGRHGIRRSDWRETLSFLDARLKPAPSPDWLRE